MEQHKPAQTPTLLCPSWGEKYVAIFERLRMYRPRAYEMKSIVHDHIQILNSL